MDKISSDQLEALKRTFGMFDTNNAGFVPSSKITGILTTLEIKFEEDDVKKKIEAANLAKEGEVTFDNFLNILSNYMADDDEEDEAMYEELKEAFRLYDREGNGYITTGTLKDILRELDNKLTEEDLDGIIEEVDEDGSGTVDFDEFMEMMTG